MQKNRVFALVLMLASSLWVSPGASAQEAAASLPWYQIELIVFSRTPTGAENAEYWDEDPGSPAVADAHPLTGDGSGAYARLPASAFRLDKEYGGLRAARGRIAPLLHLAWRQPIARGRAAQAVYITTGDPRGYSSSSARATSPPPAVEGTVKVRLNRYLHAELDLLTSGYRRASPAPGAATSVDGAHTESGYGRIRMRAHRRLRSGELHYIDHPWLGVLMLITPY